MILQKVVNLRPDDAHAHNTLGVALARVKEFNRAITELQAALRLAPGNATYDKNLACVANALRNCALTP